MSHTPTKIPHGVVLVFIDEDGHAVAHACDFHLQASVGYTLREAQRARAKHALAWAVCNAYASPQFVRGLDEYDCGRVVERLCAKHGCSVQEIAIGHEK